MPQKQFADSSAVHWQLATGRYLWLKTDPNFTCCHRHFKKKNWRACWFIRCTGLYIFFIISNQVEVVFLMSYLLAQTPVLYSWTPLRCPGKTVINHYSHSWNFCQHLSFPICIRTGLALTSVHSDRLKPELGLRWFPCTPELLSLDGKYMGRFFPCVILCQHS